MNQAISYIRYSTKSQGAQFGKDSYRRQYEATQKYCAENGLVLADNKYEDLGVSGFKGLHKRKGALGKLITDVEEGRIPKGTTLIIESHDRLSRQNVRSQMMLLLQLLDGGLNIVTLLDKRVYLHTGHPDADKTDASMELVISLMMMAKGNAESADKSKRVAEAWQSRFKRMKAGEKTSQNLPSWIYYKGGELFLHEDVKEICTRVYQLMVDDNLGGASVARILNEEGFKPWGALTSKVWKAQQIRHIFSNSSLYGLYTPHTEIEGKRIEKTKHSFMYYPPALSKEKFDILQARLHSRKNEGGGFEKGQFNNLFRGYTYCTCGARLHYHSMRNNGKNYEYLTCSDKCDTRNRPYDITFTALLHAAWNIDWLGLKVGQAKTTLDKIADNEKKQLELDGIHQSNALLMEVWRKTKSETILEEIGKNDEKIKSLKEEIKPVQESFNYNANMDHLIKNGTWLPDIDWQDSRTRSFALRLFQNTFERVEVVTPDINTTLFKSVIKDGDTNYISMHRKGIKSAYRLVIWSKESWLAELDYLKDLAARGEDDLHLESGEPVVRPKEEYREPTDLFDFWETMAKPYYTDENRSDCWGDDD